MIRPLKRKRRSCSDRNPVASSKPRKTHQPDGVELQNSSPCPPSDCTPVEIAREPGCSDTMQEDGGREKLQIHRSDIAGRVWIPEIWGQEELLKDWTDSAAFDRSLVPGGIMSARNALVEECRRTNSSDLRIGNQC